MKVLLIDDDSEHGWKEVLEKVIFNEDPIDSVSNEIAAIEKLKDVTYDLIVLDLRFGEIDHKNGHVKNYGGYRILTGHIRSSFSSINFSTPVLLFTASNKAWNIIEMIENGIDGFYIKEHPDTAF